MKLSDAAVEMYVSHVRIIHREIKKGLPGLVYPGWIPLCSHHASDCKYRACMFETEPGHITFIETNLEISFVAILPSC